ncbi:hypothetical protein PMO31116_00532 [Pandoraea morbifera]|uniref:Uncharacterized protein n=1 Tax=Pandoraea morbifera TaxID=2508300 RepID=A0A5E4S4W7_9BURK|nr:hypothetical protein [Pandoraea morbifera]VVD69624.1 hypothetical protein PMO31116_00532 [Pandoraea morbifera]
MEDLTFYELDSAGASTVTAQDDGFEPEVDTSQGLVVFTSNNEKLTTEDLMEEMRQRLHRVLTFLPASNGNMLLNILAMVEDDKRERLMYYLEREEILSNKTVLMTFLGMMASVNVLEDAISAGDKMEAHLTTRFRAVSNLLVDEFETRLIKALIDASQHVDNLAFKIKDELKNAHNTFKDSVAMFAKTYEVEADKSLEALNNKVIEMMTGIEVKRLQAEKKILQSQSADLKAYIRHALTMAFFATMGGVTLLLIAFKLFF